VVERSLVLVGLYAGVVCTPCLLFMPRFLTWFVLVVVLDVPIYLWIVIIQEFTLLGYERHMLYGSFVYLMTAHVNCFMRTLSDS
jgi:hypothetical protein